VQAVPRPSAPAPVAPLGEAPGKTDQVPVVDPPVKS
jgi:hypothetical protein